MQSTIQNDVKIALNEDLASQQDITALLIPKSKQANACIITRENVVLCGKAWVKEVFQQIDATIKINWKFNDGHFISANDTICQLSGPARGLLTGERTALNFLQMLSYTATITHQYAELLKGTETKLLDTRKTIPGMRRAQKYAVTCGGGYNHRLGLYDAFLIKENHIHACGSINNAIAAARKISPNKPIEIEVESLEQLKTAISAQVDIVMLDNFTLEEMQKAVIINQKRVKLEASGNINLENIRDVAKTGVDFISVGALTKNIKSIDLSMYFE